MRRAISLGSLVVAIGCSVATKPPRKAERPTLVATSPDQDDILLRHLLHRLNDSDAEIGKLENKVIDHDNKCLQDQIATLEGHSVKSPKRDPADMARTLSESMQVSMHRLTQNLLDGEAVISAHNRKHPEAPWAETKDLLREMCGDCTNERAARAAMLVEEAPKPFTPVTPPPNKGSNPQ